MKLKRFLALLAAVLALGMLANLVSADWQDNATDVSKIRYTIPRMYGKHVLDGEISREEYGDELKFDTADLSIAVGTADIEDVVGNPIHLWMSYDDDYVYVAATTKAQGFVNECDDNPGNLWGQYAIQLSFAESDNDDASARLETGYALSSATGHLLTATWSDGLGTGYDADEKGDYTVVNDGKEIKYEVRVPFSAFSEKALNEKDTFRFCIVWATGTGTGDDTSEYQHEQLAYGITGDPGKDVTGHATITLGEKVEPPASAPDPDPMPIPEPQNPNGNGTGTSGTPQTADPGLFAALASMAFAGAVLFGGKRTGIFG